MVTKKVLRENGMLSMKWLWDMLRVPTRVGRVIERGLERTFEQRLTSTKHLRKENYIIQWIIIFKIK